ncbi:MAG: hypothetical protein UH788_02965 [Treponemataceae bacterium]|nr:hypothetical protein [Treponemataceae bacterium]
MKKIILFTIFILTCCFVSAETFEYTPNFPDIYTAREIALADNYVADTSSYFSVWSNPANAGITGNKLILPFISLDMYSDFEKSIPLILSSLDSTPEGLAEYLEQNDTSALKMNIIGPLCLGSIKNNFFWGIFNDTYTTIDVKDIDTGLVTGGEQTIFSAGYAYPIKLPLNSVISVGLSVKGFTDIQGLVEKQPIEGLLALKDFDFNTIPLYTTFGFGFDAGITFSLFDIVIVSASWNNFFAAAYTKKYDILEDLFHFQNKYDTKATMPLEDNLILGSVIKIPLAKVTKGLISKFDGYVNCSHFLSLFEETEEEINYMEFFTFGTEIELLSTISLRAGLNSEYLSLGAGLKMGVVKLDLGIYSKAWGLNKVDTKEIGFSFSLGTYK